MKLLGRLWGEVETLVRELGLPERMISPLVDAATRYKVRNAIYRKSAEISENLASRDLKALVDHGLLDAKGENRGRYYAASARLLTLRESCYEEFSAPDPFEQSGSNLFLPGMEP